MYKHLLVPVDGSALTERAMKTAVEFAKQLGASITGFIAEPLPPVPPGPRSSALLELDASEPDGLTGVYAKEVLARFQAVAQAAGVPFKAYHDHVARVDRAIVAAAESQGCDMIVMVTHGRGAFGEFLYGSQTKAVLATSKLPLLVLH